MRIAAPFGDGRQRIAPMPARFSRLHPGLRLQLDLRETPWPDRHDSDVVIPIGRAGACNGRLARQRAGAGAGAHAPRPQRARAGAAGFLEDSMGKPALSAPAPAAPAAPAPPSARTARAR
ncbi:hypothetical protein GCM10023165_33040 [Variovorax defluvii]|uniref:LysR substrate-binding domain-containing protein n=1 Tax=Variovorax defluvii TaxID=913761 RepID=A0ABP8HYW6_9BURK